MRNAISIGIAAALSLFLSACSSPVAQIISPSPSGTAESAPSPSPPPASAPGPTAAPGDFTLDAVVTAAEKHLSGYQFTEIPADELKTLYPEIAALPVDIRARRAGDGSEYLVLATRDHSDFGKLKDGKKMLEQASSGRAGALGMHYAVFAEGYNKFAVAAIARDNAGDLANAALWSITGFYMQD